MADKILFAIVGVIGVVIMIAAAIGGAINIHDELSSIDAGGIIVLLILAAGGGFFWAKY